MGKNLDTFHTPFVTTMLGYLGQLALKKADDAASDSAETIQDILSSEGSITKVLSPTIVTPVIVVERSLRSHDKISKIISSNVNIFFAWYAQALKYMIDVDGKEAKIALSILSSSNKHIGLEEQVIIDDNGLDFSNPSYFDSIDKTGLESRNDKLIDKVDSEISNNYAKFIELEITIKDKKITLPITIKPHIFIADTDSLFNAADIDNRNVSFINRIVELYAGEITLADFIFCTDLIKKYKQNLIKDKEGLIKLINERKFDRTKDIKNKHKSLSVYHSTVILSNSTLDRLNRGLNYKIRKRNEDKERLLENYAALILTVVDTNEELIELFTKDIQGQSILYFSELTNKKTNSDKELTDIFRNLLVNKNPY